MASYRAYSTGTINRFRSGMADVAWAAVGCD